VDTVFPRKRFFYAGSTVCRECHSSASIGDQYGIWLSSPHAKSIKTLKTGKAQQIAKKHSVKDPLGNRKCLKCHTTGGGKVSELLNEGVGCEACHGPGRGYYRASIHVNFLNRKNGYEKAKRYGMYPILDFEDNLKNREKLCTRCHNQMRPCLPETTGEIQKQKIYIQVIDRLKKGEINFSHKLRRF